jgi:preprotein translocase subunit YajC
VKIPDYISPVVAYRVWRWDDTGLKSLNGELWCAGRPLEATCRAAVPGIVFGCERPVHGAHELPHPECSCGVYAAKSIEHLRQFGYEGRGIQGEVYLWGTVVEHKLGWRAQFAYPKSLFLPPDVVPFALAELDARLDTLIVFGVDIFVLRDNEGVRLWKNGSGYDAAGLDYIIRLRQKHYLRQKRERTLKKGDRVAVLGRGIAVVEQTDNKEALVVLGNRHVVRIARKGIVLNQQNRRWETSLTDVSDTELR